MKIDIDFIFLKKECIKILDGRGWDDKDRVDLRSRSSMIDYLRFYEVRGF